MKKPPASDVREPLSAADQKALARAIELGLVPKMKAALAKKPGEKLGMPATDA